MFRSLILSLSAVLLLHSASFAQVKLERKYSENTKYTTSIDAKTQQTLAIAGMNNETSAEQNSVVSSETGKRDANGTLRIVNKVDTLQVRMKAPGVGELTFDSVNPDKATESPLTGIFKASAKSTWTVVVDKGGRVSAVEGRDKAFEGLDPATAASIKGVYDADHLKDVANREIDRIPSRPVKKGDSWEQSETMKLDSMQSLTFKKKYTYAGPTMKNGKPVEQIDVVSTEVKLDIDGNNPVGLKLVKSDLKVADSKGTLLFDRTLGRVVSDSQKNQIKGDLTLAVAGQELPGSLDLTMEIVSNERQ